MTSEHGFVDAEKASRPVTGTGVWTGVWRSGSYDWKKRPGSATGARREEPEAVITHVLTEPDGTYGYRRVRAALARRGVTVGPETVRDLVPVLDLTPCQPRPRRPTTTVAGDAGGLPDLVGRDFSADAPGRELVGGIPPPLSGGRYPHTSGPGKGGSVSRRSSAATPKNASGTPWPTTCAPGSSSRPWTRQPQDTRSPTT